MHLLYDFAYGLSLVTMSNQNNNLESLGNKIHKLLAYLQHLLFHHADIADQGYKLCNAWLKFCLSKLSSDGVITFIYNLIIKSSASLELQDKLLYQDKFKYPMQKITN